MTLIQRLRSALLAACALTGLAAVAAPAAAVANTWDTIQESGVIRIGVIPNRPPYFWQEDGEWVGFSAEMGRDLAKALTTEFGKEIKPEFVITSWTTVVLDIQANKVDSFFGLSFSEERKKALNLVGPLYSLPNVALNAVNFKPSGDKWDDYNKPDVKVAVVMGTTDEQSARKFLPNADIRALKGMAEAVLDVQSGNSNALVTTVLTGLGALKANKSLGSMTVLMPAHTLPSFGGTRRDGDDRFAQWLQKWAETYRAEGKSKEVIFNAMNKLDLDVSQIPADVKF
ncbi:ABC transporter substrate-binding protein [Agaricicola taiwanensis]|uniref:ABC transporter substrate-binding protein n=1 Tax=Agaricicola taiwanensis TaxID=591372 RepID=A0A8J3DYI4_9RHOB|nr:transporter substrate-binding domain-containing protein [Agaricicola taiwanensis]GGE50311.1 ABC transporter substrate-binding protein [Agaricicola taiwanensis]